MTSKVTFRFQSQCGLIFNVTPSLVNDINALIDKVRGEIKNEIELNQRFIGYLSVPISSSGGGDRQTNLDMASEIAKNVQKDFGEKLWILNPAKYDLPKDASGGDYMAVWGDVLAGDDGSGSHIDLAYFVGPSDIWRFFKTSGTNRLGDIDAWLSEKAKDDPRYKAILDDSVKYSNFLRYYGLRGSAVYSKGAHDEWNIVRILNTKRSISNQIAIYFNGIPIEPGDYGDVSIPGYESLILH